MCLVAPSVVWMSINMALVFVGSYIVTFHAVCISKAFLHKLCNSKMFLSRSKQFSWIVAVHTIRNSGRAVRPIFTGRQNIASARAKIRYKQEIWDARLSWTISTKIYFFNVRHSITESQKFTKTFYFKFQGRLRLSTVVLPERLLAVPVLVMISNKSAPICSRSHAID